MIIPSFNAAKYITEAVDSVLAQTHKPLEIIVVDDGSSDNTKEVLKPFIESRKIKYFYRENKGPGAARNRGIKESNGDLIAFLDSDDVWLPEKLEKQLKLFQNPETVLVYSDMEMLGGDDSGKRFSKVFKIKRFYRGRVFNRLIEENFIPNSTVVVRKNTLQGIGGFVEDRKFFSAEDYLCWLFLVRRGSVDFIDEALVLYRWHANNISHQSDRESYQRLVGIYAKLIYEFGFDFRIFWKYLESIVKMLVL